MSKNIKQATLFKFVKREMFLIHSVSKTKGPSIATPPFIWMEQSLSWVEIADQLLVALQNSQSGLPVPVDWAGFSRDYLNSIGLKSLSEFYKDCLSVEVLLKDGSLDFTPMANHGKDGFMNLVPHKKITLEEDSKMEEIGCAIKEALKLCE